MGAGNVKLVYARWHDLPDLPFRLLAYMALVSMDEDAEPSYWGGWEALALAIGRLVPPRSDANPEAVKVRRAALKAVATATNRLIEKRAIFVKVAAAPGRNATYGLNLSNRTVHAQGEPSADIDGSNGSPLADTTVHAQPTNGSRLPTPTVHAHSEPEEYEEEVRTKPKDEIAGVDLTATGPRASDTDANPIPSSDEIPVLRLVTDTPRPTVGSRRWSSRGADAIAEAMARRAAARAQHQNAGETA